MDRLSAAVAATAAMAGGLAVWRRRAAADRRPSILAVTEPYCIATGCGGYDQLQARPLGGAGGATRCAAEGEKPGTRMVTVKVEAAGVNYADICIRWGLYESWNLFGGGRRPGGPEKGDVCGFEFAGTVLDAPPGSRFAVGDAVFGVTLFGAYSCRLAVPEHLLFLRPDVLTSAQAAALPAVAMTAWYAVEQLAAPIVPGGWVMVHSAAGGVGSMLVQMLKIRGAKVAGVVGASKKVDAARKLGCDAVIDKSQSDLWSAASAVSPAGFAAIFDANGAATLKQSYEHLAPGGKLVAYGFHSMFPRQGGVLGLKEWLGLAVSWLRSPTFDPLQMVPQNRSVCAFNLSFMFDRTDLLETAFAEILSWVGSGRLTLPLVSEYPLSSVRHAHADLESGMTIGKLVLVPEF